MATRNEGPHSNTKAEKRDSHRSSSYSGRRSLNHSLENNRISDMVHHIGSIVYVYTLLFLSRSSTFGRRNGQTKRLRKKEE